MTHDITPPADHVAGESLTQEFTVTQGGSPKDITGASVSWYLLPAAGAAPGDAVLDDSDSGVSVTIVNAAGGRADVVIDQDVTTSFGGETYHQRLVVDDAGSGKQIWNGAFQVLFA